MQGSEVPVAERNVPPWRPSPGPPQDPVDHLPVIIPTASAARRPVRQERLQPSPLRISQIVTIEHRPGLPNPPVKIGETRPSSTTCPPDAAYSGSNRRNGANGTVPGSCRQVVDQCTWITVDSALWRSGRQGPAPGRGRGLDHGPGLAAGCAVLARCPLPRFVADCCGPCPALPPGAGEELLGLLLWRPEPCVMNRTRVATARGSPVAVTLTHGDRGEAPS